MQNYYNNKINVITTPKGEKVVVMDDGVFTRIMNHIWDASEYQKSRGLDATANDTMELWRTLDEKDN